MQSRIAIEIAQHFGARADDLLIGGYHYGRFGLVSFVLNGVEPRQVDKVLDPIVERLGLRIPGVEYIDIDAKTDVHRVILEAKAIVAASETFSRIVDEVLWRGTASPQWRALRSKGPREELKLRMIKKASSSLK